jgi:uncharacterized protein involved in exopolysaccharide biosynthesis
MGNNIHSVREKEITFKEIIFKLQELYKYLLSKWIIIFIASLIGGLAGLAYAYSKKSIYVAELTFVLEEEKSSGLGGYAGIAGQFGIDLGGNSGGSAFQGENLLSLMKSRSMIEKALLTAVEIKSTRVTMAELYIDMNNLRDKWDQEKSELRNISFLPDLTPSRLTLNQNSLIKSFHGALIKNNLSVDKIDKKTNIISIKVQSESELFSKFFSEILAKKVSDFYIETKTRKSVDNIKILETQTDSIRRALNFAMTSAAVLNDANPNSNPARQVLRVPSQQKQGDTQANQAILIQLVQNLEISRVALRKETPLIQVIDKPVLPLDKIVFGKIKGIILGALLASILIIMFLIINKLYHNMFLGI